jgi:5-methylcytosine-specific restriction protein A
MSPALDERTFPEGAVTRVEVNKYERDPHARKECLEHYGYRCAVCKFSFEDRYGPQISGSRAVAGVKCLASARCGR